MPNKFTREEAENIVSLYREKEVRLQLEFLKKAQLKLQGKEVGTSSELQDINKAIRNIRSQMTRLRPKYLEVISSGIIPKSALAKLNKTYDDILKSVNEDIVDAEQQYKELSTPPTEIKTYDDLIRSNLKLGQKDPIPPELLDFIFNRLASIGFSPKNKSYISIFSALNKYLGKNTDRGFSILKTLLESYKEFLRESSSSTGQKTLFPLDLVQLKQEEEVSPQKEEKKLTYEDVIRKTLRKKSGPIPPEFLSFVFDKLSSVGFTPKNKNYISVFGALNKYLGKNTERGFSILDQLLKSFKQTSSEEPQEGQQSLFSLDLLETTLKEPPKQQSEESKKQLSIFDIEQKSSEVSQLSTEQEFQKAKTEEVRQKRIAAASKKLKQALQRRITAEEKTVNILQKLYEKNNLNKLKELTGISSGSKKKIDELYTGLVQFGIVPKSDNYKDVIDALISITGGYDEDKVKILVKELIKRSKLGSVPKKITDFFIDQTKLETAIREQQEETRKQTTSDLTKKLKQALKRRISAEEKTINILQKLYDKNNIRKLEELTGLTSRSKTKIKNLFDALVQLKVYPKSEKYEDVIEALASITGGYDEEKIKLIVKELITRGKKGRVPITSQEAFSKQSELESKIKENQLQEEQNKEKRKQKEEADRQKEIVKAAKAIRKTLKTRISEAKKQERQQQELSRQQQIQELEQLIGISREDKESLKKLKAGLIRQGITPESGRFEDIAKAVKQNYGRFGTQRTQQITQGLIQRGIGRQQTYKKFARETKTERELELQGTSKKSKSGTPKKPRKPSKPPAPLKGTGVSGTGTRERLSKKLQLPEKEILDANLIKKYGKRYEDALITSFRAKNIFAKSIHEQTIRLNGGLIDLFQNIDKLLTDNGGSQPPTASSGGPTTPPNAPSGGGGGSGGIPQYPSGNSPSGPSSPSTNSSSPSPTPPQSPSDTQQQSWFDKAKESFFPGFDELKEQTKQKRVDTAVEYGKEIFDNLKNRGPKIKPPSSATKVVDKEIGEAAIKGVEKVVGKTATEAAGKSLGKKIPGASILLGGAFAAERAAKGDWIGALGELTSGIASTIPGLGTLVSVGIDATLAGKDILSDSQKPVPALASGGIISNPTLALIGEGGEPEYIIPRSDFFSSISETMTKLGGDLFSFSPSRASSQQLVGLIKGLLGFIGGPANLIGSALGSTINYLSNIFKAKPLHAGEIFGATDKLNPNKSAIQELVKNITEQIKSATSSLSGGISGMLPGGITGQPGDIVGAEGAVPEGTNEDFWTLVAIAALENGDPQGQADVAQSIYNRLASRKYTGSTIKQLILAENQYSPVKESNKSLWAQIKDKQSAIAAVASHKNGTNAAAMVEAAAKNITNPQLQQAAREFIGGRTDFQSLSAYPTPPPGAIGLVERAGHRFGWYVGEGSKAYGRTNPVAAAIPSFLGITTPASVAGLASTGEYDIIIPLDHVPSELSGRFPDDDAKTSFTQSRATGAMGLEREAQDPASKLLKSALEGRGYRVRIVKPEEFRSYQSYDRFLAQQAEKGIRVLPLHFDAVGGGFLTRTKAGDAADLQFADPIQRVLVDFQRRNPDLGRISRDTAANATINRAAAAPAALVELGVLQAWKTRYGSNFTNTPTFKSLITNIAQSINLPARSQASMTGGMGGIVMPARGIITSNFGWRWGREHKGMDIAGPVGTPIVAAESGIIQFAKKGWNGAFGNLIELKTNTGRVHAFAHLSDILVREGQVVSAGQLIGKMGNTGRSTGPHLHWEVRVNGRAVDPRTVLSPTAPTPVPAANNTQRNRPIVVPVRNTRPTNRSQQQQPQIDFRMIYQNPANFRVYNGFSPVPQIPTGARF